MRRLSFNMLTGALFRVLSVLTGLAVQRYILTIYGSGVNGVTSSIAQILSYLAVLEAGIGAATVSSLHKPLRDGDTERLSALLSESRRMYRRAGLTFLAFLAVISAVLPLVTLGEMEPFTVAALTVLGGVSTAVSYLFVGKYAPLLTADGRIGVLYITDSVNILLSCGVRVFLMHAGANIVAVQAVIPICAVLRAITVSVYCKIHYFSVNYRAEPAIELRTARRSAMTHQIVGLAVNHTDITLLTLLSTLKNVSLYSVYHYIYFSICTLLESSVGQTMTGYLGKKATKGREAFNSAFIAVEGIYNPILYLLLSVALVLTLPFVKLYTAGVDDMEYAFPLLALLFCLSAFLNLIRLPYITAINVYGYFKETERSAVIEFAVNLAVSLILFPFFGINGLLIGTVTAYLFRTADTVRFVYKKCGLSFHQLFRSNIGSVIASAAVILAFFVFFPVTATSLWEWIMKATAIMLVSAALFILTNLPFNGKALIKAIRGARAEE